MSKLVVINALGKDYYDDCHIVGSINVPLENLAEYAKKLDKNDEIITYCARYACSVSRKAWHVLHQAGFTNVHAYEGGMQEWKHLKYPAQGACRLDYLKGHEKPVEGDKAIKTISSADLLKKMKAHKLIS